MLGAYHRSVWPRAASLLVDRIYVLEGNDGAHIGLAIEDALMGEYLDLGVLPSGRTHDVDLVADHCVGAARIAPAEVYREVLDDGAAADDLEGRHRATGDLLELARRGEDEVS